MRKIPVLSSDTTLNAAIARQCARFGVEFSPEFFEDPAGMVEFIKYELPELKILYFSDAKIDCMSVLKVIQADPWLHYGGIIAVHDTEDEKTLLDAMKNANVVAVLRKRGFSSDFPRLLRIIRQNKQILFQRGLQLHLLRDISGAIVLDNDPLDVTACTNLVTNYLYNANLVVKDEKEKLHVALLELLINAIEHGNCKISYDEKTEWLESKGDMMDLIRQKNLDPEIGKRKVRIAYTIGADRSSFSISDDGEGFDWRSRLASKEMEPGLHGVGMKMANIYVRNLSYNDKGNEVRFEIEHHKAESNTIPGIFASAKEVKFDDGALVCKEGEESDVLFYIVSGTLFVYSKGKLVSSLSPDDIFMGEMSFLLSNRRSATVMAKGPVVLIEISKQDFVNLIKDNPHYGIFLARLLAQRLARLNARTAKLNAEYLRLLNSAGPAGPSAGSA